MSSTAAQRDGIDINADAGESADVEADEKLLEFVTSINIACGVHAGCEATIARLSASAHALGVGSGAHPGLAGGRTSAPVSPEQAMRAVREQVLAFLKASRAPLQHIKLHGALYHAARDPEVAAAVVAALRGLPQAILIAQADSPLISAARSGGIPVASEAFLDRGYRPDGTLVPRGLPGALIESAEEAALRAVGIATENRLTAVDGTRIDVDAVTLCIHADTPGAIELAAAARAALQRAGIRVRPLGDR